MNNHDLLGSWINVLGFRLGSTTNDTSAIATLPTQGDILKGATADFILLADGNKIAYATKPV